VTPSPDNPGLEIQLSNFSFVSYPLKKGQPNVRRLRFALVLMGEHPTEGALGMTFDGCLSYVNETGDLVWSPPVARVGFAKIHVGWVTPQLDRLVIRELAKSPYIAELQTEQWEKVGRIENQEVIRVR
jgi:hypothetical protein